MTIGANVSRLPRRSYGRKGEIELSILGFPGIVLSRMEQEHANRLVAESIERGVNYFDVAPTYGDAEQKLGPALRPYRGNVFLACKTTERQRGPAEAEFKHSLEHLQTGHFDLYQLHALTEVEKDVEAAFAKGGVMEMVLEARQRGQIRHVGFSAHSVAAALAAMDRFEFDSILFPVNYTMFHRGNFGPQIMEKAKAKNVSVLALKMLARQNWPKGDPRRKEFKTWYEPITDRREALLAMKFTLGQEIVAAIPPGNEGLLRMAWELAEELSPITGEETAELVARSQNLGPLFTA